MHPNGLVLALALLAGCGSPSVAQERYPDDITPPPGTRYPCALTPLPKSLAGIPEDERGYINRTYTRVLRATQTKLVVLKALDEGADPAAAFRRYDAATSRLVDAIRADTPPAGLQEFQSDLVAAIELQRTFFRRGAELRAAGRGMDAVWALPDGRAASSRLMSAWQRMASRYPSWNEATKDSIYHHLCALDLF